MHVPYFPNADPKIQVWFVSYWYYENLQMNKSIFSSWIIMLDPWVYDRNTEYKGTHSLMQAYFL